MYKEVIEKGFTPGYKYLSRGDRFPGLLSGEFGYFHLQQTSLNLIYVRWLYKRATGQYVKRTVTLFHLVLHQMLNSRMTLSQPISHHMFRVKSYY